MLVAWDTETCLIRPGLTAPPLVCFSWYTGEGDPSIVGWKEAKTILQGWLEDPEVTMILANAAFDMAVVSVQFPDLMPLVFQAYADGRIRDILLRQKLIDIAMGCYRMKWDWRGREIPDGYSLAKLSIRHLGKHLDKDTWRTSYAQLREVPLEDWPPGALHYAAEDARSTFDVYKAQNEDPDYSALMTDNEPFQLRAAWALHLMTAYGIRTDGPAVVELESTLKLEREKTIAALKSNGLLSSNGRRNTKEAKARMIAALGERCKLNPTGVQKVEAGESRLAAIEAGNISLDREACILSDDPLLAAYNRFTELTTLIAKDVQALKKGTKTPIQSYFEIMMETGRTSSSRPNIQNPPRAPGVRECFVPRTGNVFIACDYDKAELVSLAQICVDAFGKSRLAERLNAGMDPHLDMAAQLLGIGYEEAKARQGQGDKEIKRFRQLAKAANFGFPGGLGPKKFCMYARVQYNVQISEEEAKDLRNRWFENWPEMRKYFAVIRDLCDTEDGLAWITLTRSNRRRGAVPYTAACNTFFQALTSDGAKAALWAITRDQFLNRDSPLYGTHIVNFIHDEIIIECPEPFAHEAAMALRDVMISEYNAFTPDVPVNATPVIMRRWTKGAEPVYHNGRLIPWEDRNNV